MPSSSNAIRAGRAFVELFADDTALVRGLKRAQARLNMFGAAVANIGARMVALGAGIATPFTFAVKAASDAEEVASKFGVVFGENAAAMRAWGDEFAAQVGRGKTEIAGFLAGTQDLFVPLGFEPGAAEELSKQVTQLTVDLASFNNMADADVMRDLQAALTGSGETMKKYGVLVSEAAVKQELFNQGLDPKVASDQEKVMARLNIIMRGTTAAHGDAIRTAGGFANQMKALRGAATDTAEQIGGALLPTLAAVAGRITAAVREAGDFVSANQQLVLAIAGTATGLVAAGSSLIALGISAKLAAVGLGVVTGSITALGAVFGALLSPLGLVTTAVVGGAGAWLVYSDSGQQALAAIAARFESFKADAIGAFQGVVDALAAGDLQLAGEVAMAGLNVAWQHGWNALQTVWFNFRDTLSEAWIDLSAGMQVIWAELFAELSRAFPGLVEVAATAGTAIQGFFENVATSVLEATGQITAAEAEFAREFREQERTIALRAEIERIQEAGANPEAFLRRELAAIEEARQAAQQARAAGTAAEIKAAEEALERAQQRLRESIAAAATARANAPAPEATRINVAVPDLDAIGARLGEAADAMVSAGDQLPQALQVGSREAAEQILRSIAPGNAQNDLERRQLAEIQQSKDLLKELVDFGRSHPILRASTI